MGCIFVGRKTTKQKWEEGKEVVSEKHGCLAMVKERWTKFYIARKCVIMLLCWHKYGGPEAFKRLTKFSTKQYYSHAWRCGFVWLGWTRFNGGSPFAVGRTAALAIINNYLCTATSLLVWVSLDMIVYKKSSVIGAVQGIITGLVCITSGAGFVEPWGALLMGAAIGAIPWYTMMVLHRRLQFFQSVDDTLGVFHTHAVAGFLGGILSGVLAISKVIKMMYGCAKYNSGLVYTLFNGKILIGLKQIGFQMVGAAFITAWNAIVTSLICILVCRFVNFRMDMDEEDLEIGDDAAHGEEAYALWGGRRREVTENSPAPNTSKTSFHLPETSLKLVFGGINSRMMYYLLLNVWFCFGCVSFILIFVKCGR